MRVFLSWSGEESRQVTAILRDWIEQLLQSVEPWMSERDIASGSRWRDAIAENLEIAKVGIICLTPENVGSPWIHFEAGALSKTVDDAFVCPLLIGIEPADMIGPMTQFQAQRFGHDGLLKTLETIRSHPDHKKTLVDSQFVDLFDERWPFLEARINEKRGLLPGKTSSRKVPDMVSETLELVREIGRIVKNPDIAARSKVEEISEMAPYGHRPVAALTHQAKSLSVVEI